MRLIGHTENGRAIVEMLDSEWSELVSEYREIKQWSKDFTRRMKAMGISDRTVDAFVRAVVFHQGNNGFMMDSLGNFIKFDAWILTALEQRSQIASLQGIGKKMVNEILGAVSKYLNDQPS